MSLKKYIPDTITSMNLLCGVMGVIFTLKGRPDTGFLLMILGAVCDFFDGFAARLLKSSSGIGKELDSLADLVSFGVLPSVMLCEIGGRGGFLKFFPVILAAFSAFRLAKFNLDERQHFSFLGLPTPASAMVCGSLAYYVTLFPGSFLAAWCQGPVFLPVLALCLGVLLVSEVPMFSMKMGGVGETPSWENAKRLAFLAVTVAAALIVAFTGSNWSLIVLSAFLGYILVNLAFALSGR